MAKAQNSEVSSKIASTSENVVFKGYKTGLTLVIPEAGPFEQYMLEIKLRLEQSQDFFRGARIILDSGKRVIGEKERTSLVQLIKEFGLSPYFLEDITAKTSKHPDDEKVPNEDDRFKATITVKKTVRSGQRITFEGNLVIIGDVNPGAEVVASGDIIVLGVLRGTAHAGAEGDESAQIISFQLRPVQIRIAGVITRDAEQDQKVKYMGPEVARIKDGMIVVERYNY